MQAPSPFPSPSLPRCHPGRWGGRWRSGTLSPGQGQDEPGWIPGSGDILGWCHWDWLCLAGGIHIHTFLSKAPRRDRRVWEPRPSWGQRWHRVGLAGHMRWAMARCHPGRPVPLPRDSRVPADPAPPSSSLPEREFGCGTRGFSAEPREGAACGGQGEYRSSTAPQTRLCRSPDPSQPWGTGARRGRAGSPPGSPRLSGAPAAGARPGHQAPPAGGGHALQDRGRAPLVPLHPARLPGTAWKGVEPKSPLPAAWGAPSPADPPRPPSTT